MAYSLRMMGVGWRLLVVSVGCGCWLSSDRVMANPAAGTSVTDQFVACPSWSAMLRHAERSEGSERSAELEGLEGSGVAPCPAEMAPLPESPHLSQAPSPTVDPLAAPLTEEELAPLDLDPTVIEQSPVLRQWLETIPDVAHDIRHQPSFRTRLRVGYANFPSSGEISGFQVGVEDVFLLPGTGLTASGDYSRSTNGQRESYGAEARYYLMPLGGYVNVAPSVGYRSVSTSAYSTDGLDVGLRLMLIPSRGGAADLALSQHWVAPGTDQEVGITSFALGYAITPQLRLGSDLQFQNSRFGRDSRWGLALEWLL